MDVEVRDRHLDVPAEKSETLIPSVAAPCDTSSGEKAWMWQARNGRLDGAADRQIGLAGVARMNAALQADFGGAALPGLAAAAHDLVQ